MARLTVVHVAEFLKNLEGQELHISEIMRSLSVSPENEGAFRTMLHRMANSRERVIKPSGYRDGKYKVLKQIKPIRWLEADESEYFDLHFPKSHTDETGFGLEKLISVSPGDLIIIAGVSNAGKSAVALNFLAENIHDHECILMGNEYTTLDNQSSPKFKRRMMRMTWADWVNGDGNARFDLWPVREDFEDYVQGGKINIIDWINLTDNFFMIGKLIENIKMALGKGIGIIVLQKEESRELARGAGFTRDLADVYLTVDPFGQYESRLTIGKVKDAKGAATGRMWAFKIVDGGANLHDIRELKKCFMCYGKGYSKGGECAECHGLGYVNKREV